MSGGGIDTKVVKRRRRKRRGMMAQRLAVIVDAMETGRVAPMILLAEWSDFLGIAGRRDARRALDGNPLMLGANPNPLKCFSRRYKSLEKGTIHTE